MDFRVQQIANGYVIEPENSYTPEYNYNLMYFAELDELLQYIKKMLEEA